MTEKCKHHSGLETKVDAFKEWKKSMEGSDGIIENLWNNINKKISLTLSISLMGVILTIVGVTFTLSYHTQQSILESLGELKTNVAVMKKQLEIGP